MYDRNQTPKKTVEFPQQTWEVGIIHILKAK